MVKSLLSDTSFASGNRSPTFLGWEKEHWDRRTGRSDNLTFRFFGRSGATIATWSDRSNVAATFSVYKVPASGQIAMAQDTVTRNHKW